MIGTIESKEQQLANGFFQSGTGPTEILILGSCRTLAYLSYFVRLNTDNKFTIRRMDPCDWTVSNVDIGSLENDKRITDVIQSSKIFIHEHLESYGMFNTSVQSRKNIWQFGISPEMNIAIPNFHDHMLLANDYVDYGGTTPEDYIERGELEMEKFCKVCDLSSFPEMAVLFRDNWRKTRFFWRPNHVAAEFTTAIFRMMNYKFLELPLDEEFWETIATEDLFREPHTKVSQSDIDGYKLEWTIL